MAHDLIVEGEEMAQAAAALAEGAPSSRAAAAVEGGRHRLRSFGRLLGGACAMQSLYDQMDRVAPTEATVFIVGESGTGKDLVAQTIHEMSARRNEPFLAVNCGAISPNLMESELFGHERGSFTGAERQHKGYFERAAGGTLFLDEVTEMPLELQVKLLRVLETGKLVRVGGQALIDVDVRVIAATNRQPEHAIAAGRLRQDLYHRLNVFPLQVPPLRAREDDVELLAESFLEELNRLYGSHKRLGESMRRHLRTREWPGNVRELKNYVYRAFILADEEVQAPRAGASEAPAAALAAESVAIPLGSTMEEAERLLIHATLRHCGGLKKRAAEVLGISAKTLYNRLEAYKREERRDAVMGF
jgi:DNA-binding NtrC family response regulator